MDSVYGFAIRFDISVTIDADDSSNEYAYFDCASPVLNHLSRTEYNVLSMSDASRYPPMRQTNFMV